MIEASSTFSQHESRPINYSQTLWNVNHDSMKSPVDRFIQESSIYIDSISDAGQGPLEGAPIPKGMVRFAEWFVNLMGVDATKYSSVNDVAKRVLCYLDYSEPYFLFVDTSVQLVPNQLKYTYRFKNSGGILPPEKIECFKVMNGWDFKPYKLAMDFINHPVTQQVLKGEYVKHTKRGDAVTLEDIHSRIGELIWGSPGFLYSWIDDWLYAFYEDMPLNTASDEEQMSIDSYRQKDYVFWVTAVLGCLVWFKSPHAIPYLTEYHPVYSAILGWDVQGNKPYIVEGSGGEAIIYGWDVYNHHHITVETNAPPGSCDCCQLPLHCTKLVNATAVKHPTCSCGQPVELDDTEFQGHSWGGACGIYRREHPTVPAFACQRCLGLLLKGRNKEWACEQSQTCPNVACSHHAGRAHYLRELTKRRTLMLTQQRS